MSPFVSISTLLLAATFPASAADWEWVPGTHPDQPGQTLTATCDGVRVAQLVHGTGQIKPYLHVFGAADELLTKGESTGNFPHHRGIYIGWNQITSALGTHDLWHLTSGTMRLVAIERLATDAESATFRARIEWRAGTSGTGSLLLTEWRTHRITRPGGDRTQIDAHFKLLADRALTLGGDLQHAGIHFRAAQEVYDRETETSFLEEPAEKFSGGGPMHWCRFLMPRGPRWYGVLQINDPANRVDELSQRGYGRFGYFGESSLAAGQWQSFNYRFVTREQSGLSSPPVLTAAETTAARQEADAAYGAFATALRSDPDDDGRSTARESIDGTDPYDSASFAPGPVWESYEAEDAALSPEAQVGKTTPGFSGTGYAEFSPQATLEAETAARSGAVVSTGFGGYTGTGYVDYVNSSGDFTEWTIHVPAAGSYPLKFRYALQSGNRPLNLEVNGAAVNASLPFPATGSWSTWSAVTADVTMQAGANVVRLTAIGSSGPNLDHLQLDAGTAGHVAWTLDSADAGMRVIRVRYLLVGTTTRHWQASVNGGTALPVSFAPTGGTWEWASFSAPLTSGSSTVRLSGPTEGAPFIDRLEVATNAPDDFAGWKAFHGLAGASENDDSDGDGFPLLWEFAANGDPSSARLTSWNQSLHPRLAVVPEGDAVLLTYRRRIDHAGLTFELQSSASLEAGGWGLQSAEETAIAPAADGITEFVTLRIGIGGGQRYFRMVVVGPPG